MSEPKGRPADRKRADGAQATGTPPVPDPRLSSDPLEAGLSPAADRIVLAEWSRMLPPVKARIPEVRIRKRWYSMAWVIPIAVVGLIVGIGVCQQIRTYEPVQSFIAQYPGTGSFQPPVTIGFPVWLRVLHFLNLLFMLFIIRAGWQILADHPRLNHDAGCEPGRESVRLRGPVPRDRMVQE